MRSATFALRSSSTKASTLGSADDSLTRPHLLGEDLVEGRSLLEAGDLPLGGVPLRDREPRGSPELLRDRQHPFGELLEPRPRGNGPTLLEIDQLAGEAVPDRA